MNRKTEFIFLAAVIFQIILLINMITAESYLINQSNPSGIQNSKIIEKKIKKTMNYGISLLIGFLNIKQIGIVSAQGLYCCPKTTESFSQLFSVSNLVFFPRTQHPFWHSRTSQALLSSHIPPSFLHFSHGELVAHNPSFSSMQHPILQLAT